MKKNSNQITSFNHQQPLFLAQNDCTHLFSIIRNLLINYQQNNINITKIQNQQLRQSLSVLNFKVHHHLNIDMRYTETINLLSNRLKKEGLTQIPKYKRSQQQDRWNDELFRKFNDAKILLSVLKTGQSLEQQFLEYGTKEIGEQVKIILDKKREIQTNTRQQLKQTLSQIRQKLMKNQPLSKSFEQALNQIQKFNNNHKDILDKIKLNQTLKQQLKDSKLKYENLFNAFEEISKNYTNLQVKIPINDNFIKQDAFSISFSKQNMEKLLQ